MAERPDFVEINICEVVGEIKLEISSRLTSENDFRLFDFPVICNTYFMSADLIIKIILQHNSRTDMIEAYLEVVAAPKNSLTFNIKYGFNPFHLYRNNPQIFIYTSTNKRSEVYRICTLEELIDYVVDNELKTKFELVDFMSTIIISPRDIKRVAAQYRIPQVNGCDCDHTLICEGREIKVHKRLLMGASKYFHRKLAANPNCTVTNIDTLDEKKRLEMEVLTCLLSFMYGLSISNHDLQTTRLLSAAREFEVNALFNVCERNLIEQLSEELVLELFYIGTTEKASRLARKAAEFILQHYQEAKLTFQWNACIQAFPRFFEPIVPNPMRYFRGIVWPNIRSRSAGDIRGGAEFIPTVPSHVLTHPLRDDMTPEPDTDTTSILGGRSSANTSRWSCDSLDDDDLEPMPRKRSSPVISRKRTDSMSSEFRMKSLNDLLPGPRSSLPPSRVSHETKFEETFGPVQSTMSDKGKMLSRSLSLTDDREGRSASGVQELDFFQPNLVESMDCREDSNLTSSESKLPDSMGPGTLSGERPDLSSPSLPSMRSLEFGFTYSYSSDSVFEHRETPKSMSRVPTPAVDMSVSEITSNIQNADVSPEAVNRIDYGRFTHPEARSLSDISSIPLDSSSSAEPESSSSRSRSRREKRMKKTAEKTRKFLPIISPNLSYDFSSSQESSISIPRPTYIKEFPTEINYSPRKTIKETRDSVESAPSCSYENKSPRRKVTFGTTDYIPTPLYIPEVADDQELDQMFDDDEEPSTQKAKYYASWIDTAYCYSIKDVFKEDTTTPSVRQDIGAEVAKKAWDEKDESEHVKISQNKTSSNPSDKGRKFKGKSPASSTESTSTELPIGGGVIRKTPTSRQVPVGGRAIRNISTSSQVPVRGSAIRQTSTSSQVPVRGAAIRQTSTSSQVPVGGGVIRKAPERFQTTSVDDPTPLSSSESVGTTSSSLSSDERKKVTKTFTGRYSLGAKNKSNDGSTIERGQSFVELRTVRRSSNLQPRNTPALAGVFSIGLQERTSQENVEEPTIPQDDVQESIIELFKELEIKMDEKKDRETENDKQ